MPETFKPGDVVQLKSGGPAMTVEVVGEDGMIACSWMDRTKLERRSFVSAVLELRPTLPTGSFVRGECDA